MNKEEVIKELLKDFEKYLSIDVSIEKGKDEVEISVVLSKRYDNIGVFYIIRDMKEIEGYLGKIKCGGKTYINNINVICKFSLAKIQDIRTIEEAVYFNTKKALEILLEEK